MAKNATLRTLSNLAKTVIRIRFYINNATLSGKKLLAKMLNGVETANCFLSF